VLVGLADETGVDLTKSLSSNLEKKTTRDAIRYPAIKNYSLVKSKNTRGAVIRMGVLLHVSSALLPLMTT